MKRELKWEPVPRGMLEKIVMNSPLIPMMGGFVIDEAVDKLDNGAGVYSAIRFTRSGKMEMAEGTLLDFQDCE